jgi:uncharacterized protein YndB with AHSA1/START domain
MWFQASHYGLDEDHPMELLVTVTLEDIDGKTKMTMKQAGVPTGEIGEQAGAGWDQSFDKLDEILK